MSPYGADGDSDVVGQSRFAGEDVPAVAAGVGRKRKSDRKSVTAQPVPPSQRAFPREPADGLDVCAALLGVP